MDYFLSYHAQITHKHTHTHINTHTHTHVCVPVILLQIFLWIFFILYFTFNTLLALSMPTCLIHVDLYLCQKIPALPLDIK